MRPLCGTAPWCFGRDRSIPDRARLVSREEELRLTTSALAETAALVGDPARASMLTTLLDGRALTATELARAAGITPQTASGHLARLVEAGLLEVARQGRHRYHRLASQEVAQMLEALMAVSRRPGAERVVRAIGPRDRAMRRARTC